MHIEVLVEDRSGAKLLESLMPKILGEHGSQHSWRIIPYKGIGRIPKNLKGVVNPSKRILLDRLPSVLRGYARTPGIDAVVIVLDSDRQSCAEFLAELKVMANDCVPSLNILFRLAIEEIEAWYLGDKTALFAAYPKARKRVIASYRQDSVCGTWELLADAIYPGGAAKLKKDGWPLPGQIKAEWAERIGPLLDLKRNESPSFQRLWNGLGRIATDSREG